MGTNMKRICVAFGMIIVLAAVGGCESRSGGELGRLDVRGISGFRGPRPVVRLVRGGASVRVLDSPCTLRR